MFRGFAGVYEEFMHSIGLPICSEMHITNFHCSYLRANLWSRNRDGSRRKMIVSDSTYVEIDLKLPEEGKVAFFWFRFERD